MYTYIIFSDDYYSVRILRSVDSQLIDYYFAILISQTEMINEILF